MAYPATFTNAVDDVTVVKAAHINNLEAKVGIDFDTNVNSLDYFKKHAPGSNKNILFNDGDVWEGASGFYWDKTSSRVGIGTASPASKLDVIGKITCSDVGGGIFALANGVDTITFTSVGRASDNFSKMRFLNNAQTIEYGSVGSDSSSLQFAYSGIERMRIDSNGRIGIGETSLDRQLIVRGIGVLIRGNNAVGTEFEDWPNPSLAIRRSDDHVINGVTMVSLGYRNDPIYSTDDSLFNFRLWDSTQTANAPNSASTTRLQIGGPGPIILQAGGGNVGIGTTAPVRPLHVSGGDIRIDTLRGLNFGDTSCNIIGSSGVSGHLRFDVNSAERVRIDSSGNVGIGTTGPGNKLHVVHDIASNLTIATFYNPSQPNGAFNYILVGKSNTNDGAAIFGFTKEVSVSRAWVGVLGDDVSGGTGLTVLKGGNVGIGTTAPATKLHVTGTIRIVDGTQGSGKFLRSDSGGTASWQTIATPTLSFGVEGFTEVSCCDCGGTPLEVKAPAGYVQTGTRVYGGSGSCGRLTNALRVYYKQLTLV